MAMLASDAANATGAVVSTAATVAGVVVTIIDSWSHDVLSKADIRVLSRLQDNYKKVFQKSCDYFEVQTSKVPRHELNPDNFDTAFWVKEMSADSNIWGQYPMVSVMVEMICDHIARLRRRRTVGWNVYRNINHPIYLTCVELLEWLVKVLAPSPCTESTADMIQQHIMYLESLQQPMEPLFPEDSRMLALLAKVAHKLQYDCSSKLEVELSNEHASEHLSALYARLRMLLISSTRLLFYLCSKERLPN
eukprot:gene27649-34127_t